MLVAGHQARRGGQGRGRRFAGVTKVLHADAPHLGEFLAENVAALLVSLAKNYSHILAPATSNGKNVMPRVAALLDVQQISDISAVESADTFVRPIYAGNALATVKSKDAIKVITVRTTAFRCGGCHRRLCVRRKRRRAGRQRPVVASSSRKSRSPSARS